MKSKFIALATVLVLIFACIPVTFISDYTTINSSAATTISEWTESNTKVYIVGVTIVTYKGKTYKCLQTHTPYVGANWNPASALTLWEIIPTTLIVTPTPSTTIKPSPTSEPTITPTSTPKPTITPTSTPKPTITPTFTPKPIVTPTSTTNPTQTPTPIVMKNNMILQIENPIGILDGIEVAIDPSNKVWPNLMNNRTLIPLRFVAESYGLSVEWNATNNEAIIKYITLPTSIQNGAMKESLIVQVENQYATLDGTQVEIDTNHNVYPINLNGRIYMPLRFLSEVIGFNIEWNGKTQQITITKVSVSPTPTVMPIPTITPTPTVIVMPTPTIKPTQIPPIHNSLVKGWPSYIAMGGVTLGDYTKTSTFAGRPLDSIFKYAGDGGNGDPGRIVYPIATTNTMTQAQMLSANFGKKVMPAMVVYTCEMSGGTSYKDLDDTSNVLTMHFINLMLESSLMQSYKTSSNPYPASIIINPDLLGMVQQQNLWNIGGTGNLNKININVNNAIQKANWFMTSKHDWNITLYSGNNITAFQKTPLEFIILVRDGAFKEKGVYSPWDVKTMWENAAVNLLAKAPTNLNAPVPIFESNFKGWIQATNWTIKSFGPDISFGWQSNVWSTGTATWVHKDLTAQQVADTYSSPVADLWNALGIYNSRYKPDFIVFDKYERDAASEVGVGYLWNQRDIKNYMNFVKSISNKIGNYPVMLWQIPGGHMQLTSGDIDTRESHGSTEPDYFFGDLKLKTDLSNVKPYFLNLQLPTGIYGTNSVKTYLTQNNQDWSKSNMDVARDCNVFSILWGGGSTTSIGTVGANDNGWLAGKIIEYYKNPTYLKNLTK